MQWWESSLPIYTLYTDAVSYTHLDVYKRQEKGIRGGLAAISNRYAKEMCIRDSPHTAPRASPPPRTSPTYFVQLLCLSPVSYTHLIQLLLVF